MPLDMCGAIAMKRHFPTAIIYIARDKEYLIRDIIEEDYDVEEKTLRILSIDAEKRNSEICDYVIDNTDDKGINRILELL
jgi:guanylate kinase